LLETLNGSFVYTMRYTLKSRFRGTIAGALLALKLANDGKSEFIKQAYIESAFSYKILIEQGKFDTSSLRNSNRIVTNSNQQILFNTFFAALPIILFFHEDLLKLRRNLVEVAQAHSDNLIVRDSLLAIGYTISQSLNEKLSKSSVFKEIINFVGETPTNVPETIKAVDCLLNSCISSEQAFTELSKVNTLSSILATAFYTFLKSLEDFCLSVSLSLSSNISNFLNHDYYISSAITGALSGAYNSTLSIPVNWQIHYLGSLSAKLAENEFLQMLRLTDELLAVWSGVYEFERQGSELSRGNNLCNYLPLLEEDSHLEVFAAPRIIRLQ
jgi:hypothetical protein